MKTSKTQIKRREVKKITCINHNTANTLRDFLERNMGKICEKAGYALTVVNVGGKYNRDRMVIEVGLLPYGATQDQIDDFIRDSKPLRAPLSKKDKIEMMKTIYNKTYLGKSIIKTSVLKWFEDLGEDHELYRFIPSCDITIKGQQSRYILVGVKQNMLAGSEKNTKILLFNLSINKHQSLTLDQFKNKATLAALHVHKL